MELKCGDIFLSRNPMMLGKIINSVQRFWSVDNKSKYSHGGIITNTGGSTLEALWTVSSQNIFEAYGGQDVLIARHKKMNKLSYIKGMRIVNKHRGQWYPFYRLMFHLIPPIAKKIHFGRVVCTELMMKFLYKSGIDIPWIGINPDMAHDIIKNNKDFDIVFEGKLNG